MRIEPVILRIDIHLHGHVERQRMDHLFLDQSTHRLLLVRRHLEDAFQRITPFIYPWKKRFITICNIEAITNCNENNKKYRKITLTISFEQVPYPGVKGIDFWTELVF